MKMSPFALCVLLSLPLGACHNNQPAAKSSAATATVGDDPAVPKLAVGTAAKCPVTGEDFTVKESTVQVTYNGNRYAFCCADCLPQFNKDPAKYAAK